MFIYVNFYQIWWLVDKKKWKKKIIETSWITEFNDFMKYSTISFATAQIACNGGTGRTVYERLPDQQLQGFDDEVVSEK